MNEKHAALKIFFLYVQNTKSKHMQSHLFLISGALQNTNVPSNVPAFKTSHVSFFLPPPSPSPPLLQWAVLWCYDVRFLRQYHSTVHRETTAVQNYTGLPRTLHPAQVGHWPHLDLSCFIFKPPVICFQTTCCCQTKLAEVAAVSCC